MAVKKEFQKVYNRFLEMGNSEILFHESILTYCLDALTLKQQVDFLFSQEGEDFLVYLEELNEVIEEYNDIDIDETLQKIETIKTIAKRKIEKAIHLFEKT